MSTKSITDKIFYDVMDLIDEYDQEITTMN